MNLFSDIRALVISALDAMVGEGALPEGLDFANVTVEPPRDAAHGDMATNAAMVLAKPAKQNPRAIADALAVKLQDDARIALADVAGPGFLNLRLDASVWGGVVQAALQGGADFGKSSMGMGRKVNVEYVSANPTGPLHVGHTRGAVFGDALASLLAYAGHDVTREYYINDGGAQVDVLARSVYLRYLEAHGQEVAFPDGTYPGDYLVEVGEALKAKVGDAFVDKGEQFWLDEVRSFSTEAMMGLIRSDLAALGIEMDVFYSEKSLYGTGQIEAAIGDLDDIKLTQLVKLTKNGEPFKMSKRAGTFVTLRDVVDEVGPDVTRFIMLTRKQDAPLDFDLDKVLEQSKDNPVFYVQYAHARVCSVLRKAADVGWDASDAVLAGQDLSANTHEAELKLAAKLAEWPRLVEIAARTNEPHRIAFYLYELAGELHALWNRGNDVPELRFLQETEANSLPKIALARATAIVISAGLGILGVTPATEMR